MSPGYHMPSSRGGVSRNARPPQSMHVISRSGSITPSVLLAAGVRNLQACVSWQESCVGVGSRRRRGPTPGRPPTRCARPCSTRSVSRDLVRDARVADLFAGTGALGIEALSRGADHCTFVERDRNVVRSLRGNIEQLGLAERSRVLNGDALEPGGVDRCRSRARRPAVRLRRVAAAADRGAGTVRRRRSRPLTRVAGRAWRRRDGSRLGASATAARG